MCTSSVDDDDDDDDEDDDDDDDNNNHAKGKASPLFQNVWNNKKKR
jgi:hypothetical protein